MAKIKFYENGAIEMCDDPTEWSPEEKAVIARDLEKTDAKKDPYEVWVQMGIPMSKRKAEKYVAVLAERGITAEVRRMSAPSE